MISVQGYQAMHGSIVYTTPDKNTGKMSDVDILYNPITECYLCGEITIPKNNVVSIVDYGSGLDETCQDHLPVLKDEEGNILDPCFYEIVAEIEDVSLEVLRCVKCGKIELSWRKGNASDKC